MTLARDILALDQEQFSAAFRKSPMQRAKLAGLRRNAAVVLNSLGDRQLAGHHAIRRTWVRIWSITLAWVLKATMRIAPWQDGHASGSTSKIRWFEPHEQPEHGAAKRLG